MAKTLDADKRVIVSVVSAVAASTALMLTVTVTLHNRTTQQLEAFGNDISEQLDAFENSTSQQLEALNEDLTARIDELDRSLNRAIDVEPAGSPP